MSSWPHSPLHIFNDKGTYMITGATYNKKKFFSSNADLDFLQQNLLFLSGKYGWNLEAWSLFPNHYHFIAQSPKDPTNLNEFLRHFHSITAIYINKLQNEKGRKVWHQFWDTQLTFQKSYLARLNYVMQNPVKHNLVTYADEYPWCSASWFKSKASKAYYETVSKMKTDKVILYDSFE